ncbi:MAG: glutamate-5-semialdehyde dehydrogenase [Clostridia bacterium]|nr:glutamate-5-semialdehyde dehydrogenase [Clostridia bacterium]
MTIQEELTNLCTNAKMASVSLALASTEDKNRLLLAIAQKLEQNKTTLLTANANDLEAADANGVPRQMLDRLTLTDRRITDICASIRDIAELEDPIGTGEEWSRPSGLLIRRIRVPLGVVGIIYEARPNVTVDSAVLCLKTGNAVVLRGGKEAIETNKAAVKLIKEALCDCGLDPHAVELVESTDRESANVLMSMRGYLDVLIPRGGKGLIRAVTENAKVPVIETGAGNCHVFVDEYADLEMAKEIVINAKCSRPSVCNAMETLLVHASIAAQFLPMLEEALRPHHVELRGCPRTRVLLPYAKEATEEDWATEYNDSILAVKVVNTLSDSIRHINRYNTGHSEAIVTANEERGLRFQREVNAAAVYVNASTRFTDGGEFGFGAEIGISTQKLHVRGPMGLRALTTEKYLIAGEGSVR